MRKDDLYLTYFKAETDVAQNLIDDYFFFSRFDCQTIGRVLNER